MGFTTNSQKLVEQQFMQSNPKETIGKNILDEVDITDIVDKLVLNENAEDTDEKTTKIQTKNTGDSATSIPSPFSASVPLTAHGSISDKISLFTNLEDKTRTTQTVASLIEQHFHGKTTIFTTIFTKLQELDTNIDREIVTIALDHLEKENKLSKEAKISKDGRSYVLLKF